jgi:hypothetical protein
MDVLYISPEFPPNYAQFVFRLHDFGARVWGLGEADFYEMPEQLRSALRWYVRTDLNSQAAVETALETLQRARSGLGFLGGFDWVESHNEVWLRLEAFINEKLGIEGIRPANLDRIKKKSAMKGVFEQCGLPVACAAKVSDHESTISLAKQLGYPLILKPDEGVGAMGIHRVDSPEELEPLLRDLPGDYLLEQWIDAPIVSFDGLSDQNGQVLFASSLVYGSGVMECVRGRDVFFYVNQTVPDGLSAIGPELVKAFNIRRKFFHFEFFNRENTYWPIEINARPPGGAIIDMMNYSADIDLYAEYARMIVSGQARVTCGERRYTAYAGRRRRSYKLSHNEVIVALGPALVEQGPNPPIFIEVMGNWRYIFRTTTEKELLRLAELVLQTG